MSKEHFLIINSTKIKQVQYSRNLYFGKITFKDLLLMHRLTERKASTTDPFREKGIDYRDEEKEFQRQLSQQKLSKIAKYVKTHLEQIQSGKEKAFGLFHTSLILALDHDLEYNPEELNGGEFFERVYNPELSSCFLSGDEKSLFIPKNQRIALVVDGQHRLYGMKKAYDDLDIDSRRVLDDFEFFTIFLLGLDIYEVAKVFVTVNFNQKPVNRSLYYDIFGSVPDTERNEIKLAHDLALHLNNNEQSPIKDMIKMLGKGYGLFSQSFFVEKMFIHFKEGGAWQHAYDDYLSYGEKYKQLPMFMKVYLECVEQAYNAAWPDRVQRGETLVYSAYHYDYVLCKTTGMGAIFRLIREIFPATRGCNSEEMRDRIMDILARISNEEAKQIFSKDGDFGQGAGEGLQVKLYRYLRTKLKLND